MSYLRKGDMVKILAGKDRGNTGKLLAVNLKSFRAVVEGQNLYWRHERPKKSGQKGTKVQLPMSISLSNLKLVCPHCGKPTRVGRIVDDKGIKSRSCKQCGKRI